MTTSVSLSEAEKEQFLTHGFIHLRNCFSKEQADEVIGDVWTRLGMDPNNKDTWTAHVTNMPHHGTFDAAKLAPRAWDAICELCGGEDKIDPETKQWRDSLIVNLGSPEYKGKDIKPQDLGGWHVDGDFFVHYLDSPEQGLLVIPLFTDIKPGGGATMICPDAIPKLAKHLYEHPEGVSPRMTPRGEPFFSSETHMPWFNDTARSCTRFVEATGECGDVYLLHPLMLHSATANPLRHLRIITNPPISMLEPFDFNREAGDFTLVEQTTLRALEKSSLPNWRITAERESIVPERTRVQAKMKEEELKRLQAVKTESAMD